MANRQHQHDRPIAELLKLKARIRPQPPDRIQKAAWNGKGQHHRAADQRARREENDEENDANGPVTSIHAQTKTIAFTAREFAIRLRLGRENLLPQRRRRQSLPTPRIESRPARDCYFKEFRNAMSA
jgi:hypothetical protein